MSPSSVNRVGRSARTISIGWPRFPRKIATHEHSNRRPGGRDGAAVLTRAGRPEIDRSHRAIGNNREI
jgi:hypothetical protein